MQGTRDISQVAALRIPKIMRTMFQAGIATALLLTCAPVFAQVTPRRPPCDPALPQVTIRWAPVAVGYASDLAAPTKAPDGKTTTVSASSYLYLQKFNEDGKIVEQKYGCLGQLLNKEVSERELANGGWDIIAFEGGKHIKGWERSIWFVTDLVGAAAGSFNGEAQMEPTPISPLRFKSGTIKATEYMQYFTGKEIELKDALGRSVAWVSWILIDVPNKAIDVKSKVFRLLVSGAHSGAPDLGNPDPDAFGVIMH